ncbi:hypothetical protein pEaSNUABM13_00240 [Erwinia phage pEa_SNUABM_13]|uniref:Uncharacterized protein n=1 Tax=Erwinia phage pEa_SNUABM_7 TaxID=2866695 RepID=A0AAE7WTR5_9CAUD|nr:hypothetical protein MPK74_gp239 [Erwinia phage pEa_SNUABM_7]QYW03199.1 hypothetical protein pEaSNUABM13_00240 [Erwinia phage pEa_SNUABM_13]QYW03540.1 hypothetical protein pEaSNUABM34_00238 [Erwinia phage pEa_SNUABM_34]QYW03882.1 hypothetical protein pEaSNUABM45_00239 [Erwinia phage pEa_SNUABM_45]QYW04223.1 hypothetical protein pEaSNUABM46_00239 [Erwinia phage pEa_SNUABM_46]QYW05252.1 hypothetical protein pEaSNUABM21_00238 [Erwinia phage pEa_SNUABM_21]QYW05594.1 hypothetical protein pEaSNU
MACAGCGRRSSKISYGRSSAPPTVVEEDDTLSAAKLTPQGWVSTCVVCGAQSTPSPFADTIQKTCDCKPQ